MRFSRFRLTGFKSFVEPTEVSIEAGLTGIVGPNGCGKSNLVEALQWAMGENSYKAMRGSGMEDVIFSGSIARPARNSAEVSLSLDNSARTVPSAFNDRDSIDVSRRIEREAGSSYRINGREVRARDVQLLFADAAIGAHSAAIVGQGRVGSLISAKPDARRAVLEEAAGISGLFGRRHEAELRLKATEQNLDRLEDILAEIERQLDGLRRQARQAVRYRNLSSAIRKSEATALAVRYRFATDTVTAAATELAHASVSVTEQAEKLGKAARAQAIAAEIIPALREQAASAEAGVQRIRIEGERLDQEERTIHEQIAELERRSTQLNSDLDRERALLSDSSATLARLADEKAGLVAETAGQDDKQADIVERLETAGGVLGESERLMAEANAALSELTARRGHTQEHLDSITEREAGIQAEQARIAEQRNALSPAGADDRLNNAADALRLAESDLTAAEQSSHAAEEQAALSRDRAAAAQSAVSESEGKLARMETEAKALQSLLPESAVRSPLIETVKPSDGAEAALAAALGDDLDLSTDTIDPAHWRQISGEGDPPLPTGVRPLSDVVDGPAELDRRLAQTGFVDVADGLRLQAELSPGQSLVSREGDMWRWDGLVASAESRRSPADRLSARRRLTELVEKIEEFRPAVEEEAERAETARHGAVEATKEDAARREFWRRAQGSVNQARDELVAAEREQSGVASRLAALSEAKSRLATGLGEVIGERETATAALEQMVLPEELEAPIAALRDKMIADRNSVAELRALLAGINRDSQTRNGRIESIERDEAAWAHRTGEAQTQMESLQSRLVQVTDSRRGLGNRPTAIAKQRRALLDKSGDADKQRAAAADTLAEAEATLAEADKTVTRANAELSEAREVRGRLEERVAGANERLVEISERISETLQCDPSEAEVVAGLTDGSVPALDQVEARLERLKQERERLGGVNLQADREAEELAERRNTMTSDRDDLIAAITKLRRGIASLNREGRERLITAFDTVNIQFQRLFAQLFGGGTAELKLVGSDDPLDAGLEIIAKPPGKKPQTMTLLSGGEQALTALSLIFALFLTNPAPICVLDEVDAPLDDANVERFCNLLEEIANETGTRFLVITHNPITMARMNRLFGVTMAERGVSQLVSVDLETAEQFREAG